MERIGLYATRLLVVWIAVSFAYANWSWMEEILTWYHNSRPEVIERQIEERLNSRSDDDKLAEWKGVLKPPREMK